MAVKTSNSFIGKYVIIRTYSAGVHVGTLVSQNGKEVMLKDTRRIWSLRICLYGDGSRWLYKEETLCNSTIV